MNEGRLHELEHKRDTLGLSDAEARELGNLMAEGSGAAVVLKPKYAPPAKPDLDQADRTNGAAIASLLFGLLGLLPVMIPSVLAIVFAVVAFTRIDRRRGGLRGSGMAGVGFLLAVAGILWSVYVIRSVGSFSFSGGI